MADQAWRDRCARAMGFVERTKYRRGDRIGLEYSSWADTPYMDDGGFSILKTYWRPDESYDQAMMMRDRCEELGLGALYDENLTGCVTMRDSPSWGAIRRAAFATAEQIADAALKTLEDARA